MAAPPRIAIAKRARRTYLMDIEATAAAAAGETREARMFKALFRLLSMILLAVAVIMAVLDATRSIAAGALVATPLGASWAAVSPDSLYRMEGLVVESLPSFLWDPVALGLLGLPGFAVFAALSLLAAMAGRRSARGRDRFAAQR